jgi:hypothetical protein
LLPLHPNHITKSLRISCRPSSTLEGTNWSMQTSRLGENYWSLRQILQNLKQIIGYSRYICCWPQREREGESHCLPQEEQTRYSLQGDLWSWPHHPRRTSDLRWFWVLGLFVEIANWETEKRVGQNCMMNNHLQTMIKVNWNLIISNFHINFESNEQAKHLRRGQLVHPPRNRNVRLLWLSGGRKARTSWSEVI